MVHLNAPLWVAAAVIATVSLATWADVRTRRIPNLLTGPALLLGVGFHLMTNGAEGARIALIGALVAGGVLLPGWVMGFMGAGDVKLMAAVGAWVGFPGSLMAALVSLIAGGVLATIVAMKNGILIQSLKRAGSIGFHLLGRTGLAGSLPSSGIRFPFAPAVLVGALFVLWRQR